MTPENFEAFFEKFMAGRIEDAAADRPTVRLLKNTEDEVSWQVSGKRGRATFKIENLKKFEEYTVRDVLAKIDEAIYLSVQQYHNLRMKG